MSPERIASAPRWRFRRRNNRLRDKLAAVEKNLRRLRLRARLGQPEGAKRANQCNRFAAPRRRSAEATRPGALPRPSFASISAAREECETSLAASGARHNTL